MASRKSPHSRYLSMTAHTAENLSLISRAETLQSMSRINGAEELLIPFDKFSPQELGSLRFDGLVKEVLLGIHAPVYLPITQELKAAAVYCFMQPGTTIVRATTAWVTGALHRIPRVELAAKRSMRPRAFGALEPARIYECALDSKEIAWIENVPVTTPQRTSIDLALWGEPGVAVKVLHHYAIRLEIDLPGLAERLAGFTRIPYQRRAIKLVELVMKNLDRENGAELSASAAEEELRSADRNRP